MFCLWCAKDKETVNARALVLDSDLFEGWNAADAEEDSGSVVSRAAAATRSPGKATRGKGGM